MSFVEKHIVEIAYIGAALAAVLTIAINLSF